MAAKKPSRGLEVGFYAAICLRPDAAPLRCYVGLVEAVDEHGVRLTLIDWVLGAPTDYDLFVAWSEITAALVSTPDHDLHDFGRRAGQWQQQQKKGE